MTPTQHRPRLALQERMRLAGYTRTRLAGVLGVSGPRVSRMYLQVRIEWPTVVKIAAALGVPPDAIARPEPGNGLATWLPAWSQSEKEAAPSTH